MLSRQLGFTVPGHLVFSVYTFTALRVHDRNKETPKNNRYMIINVYLHIIEVQ